MKLRPTTTNVLFSTPLNADDAHYLREAFAQPALTQTTDQVTSEAAPAISQNHSITITDCLILTIASLTLSFLTVLLLAHLS